MVGGWVRLFAVAVGYTVIALATAFALVWYTHYSLGFIGVYAMLLALPVPAVLAAYFLRLDIWDARIRIVATCFITYLVLFITFNFLPNVAPQITQLVIPYHRLVKYTGILAASWAFATATMIICYKIRNP